MQKQLLAFVQSIRSSGLLKQEQIEQIVAWASPENVDPSTVAKAIVKQGWLTAFQVKMFWKNRGEELILNQYVILDRLGEGGMGEVYRAKHRRMDREVALKVIRRERLVSPDAVKRFSREVQAVARLTHENIVMAYDADQSGDRHFFAMELVDGIDLAKLVKENGPMPVVLACDCIRQAALGLQHAFENGMVHRDIKPSNLLIGKRGSVKILDMGLARLNDNPDGEEQSRITREGIVIGTPDYLAPEQARNSRKADVRSDIYALGCTFHYLLTGQSPYQGGTPTERTLRHTTDPIPRIKRPDVPPQLEAIVHRMLAKRPDDRFQTPAEVAYHLMAFCGPLIPPGSMAANPRAVPQPAPQTPPAAPPPPPPPPAQERTDSRFRLPTPKPRPQPAPERTRWNPLMAVAVGFGVLALLAGVIYLIVKQNDGPTEPNYAKTFTNNHDITFVLLKPGTFDMGSPEGEEGRNPDEGPVHPVKLTKYFYMSATEVTFRQFKSVTGTRPFGYRDDPEDLDVPVTFVSFNEVQKFIKLLNDDPQSEYMKKWEYRLPTEAEWEYACRAGSKSRFSVGNSLGKEQAFYDRSTVLLPLKVGQFPANAFGLYDMHGNAAEWVMDYYDENYYANSPANDPKGPEQRKTIYVVRGGSFMDREEGCRSASRKATKMETRTNDTGFRLVYVQVGKQ